MSPDIILTSKQISEAIEDFLNKHRMFPPGKSHANCVIDAKQLAWSSTKAEITARITFTEK